MSASATAPETTALDTISQMLCAGCYTWEYVQEPQYFNVYDHLNMAVDGFELTVPNTPWEEPYEFCLAHAGCTNEEALNFNPAAELDDGSCEFDMVANPCPQDLNGGWYGQRC